MTEEQKTEQRTEEQEIEDYIRFRDYIESQVVETTEPDSPEKFEKFLEDNKLKEDPERYRELRERFKPTPTFIETDPALWTVRRERVGLTDISEVPALHYGTTEMVQEWLPGIATGFDSYSDYAFKIRSDICYTHFFMSDDSVFRNGEKEREWTSILMSKRMLKELIDNLQRAYDHMERCKSDWEEHDQYWRMSETLASSMCYPEGVERTFHQDRRKLIEESKKEKIE